MKKILSHCGSIKFGLSVISQKWIDSRRYQSWGNLFFTSLSYFCSPFIINWNTFWYALTAYFVWWVGWINMQNDELVVLDQESKIYANSTFNVWFDVIIHIVEFCSYIAIFSYGLSWCWIIIIFRIKSSNSWFVILLFNVDNILLPNFLFIHNEVYLISNEVYLISFNRSVVPNFWIKEYEYKAEIHLV